MMANVGRCAGKTFRSVCMMGTSRCPVTGCAWVARQRVTGLTAWNATSPTRSVRPTQSCSLHGSRPATATFERKGYDGKHYSADAIHGAELASLIDEFAAVRESAEVLAEIRETSAVSFG